MKKFGFIVMVLCLATSAFAFGPNDDGNKDRPKFDGRHENGRQMMDKKFDGCEGSMYCNVDLTQEQKDQMSNIRKKSDDQIFELNTEIQKAKIDQRVNMRNHDFDKAKKTAQKINDLKGKRESLKIDMMQDCYNVLTKEQKAKL